MALLGFLLAASLQAQQTGAHGGPPAAQGSQAGGTAAGPHGAEAGTPPSAHAPSIMQVDPGLMVWTVVTFVALLVVLRFTAWKPLMASLEARERRIREAVEGAERARRDGEVLLQRYHEMLEHAKDEARKILEEGKADGLRLKHEITAQARAEAEEFKTRARREVELAAEQAKKDLWEHAARLSTELAEKILRRSFDAADHRRLVEQVLDEYRAVRARGSGD